MPRQTVLKTSQKRLAEILGLTTAAISAHVTSNHFLKRPDGSICLESVLKYLHQNLRPSALKNDSSDLQKIKTEHEKLKAQKTELDLKLKRGDYLPKDQVIKDITSATLLLKDILQECIDTLPDKVVGRDVELVSSIVKDDITGLIDKYCSELNKIDNSTDIKT